MRCFIQAAALTTLAFLSYSCDKKEETPPLDKPEIEFVSVETKPMYWNEMEMGDSVKINIRYTDGGNNLGAPWPPGSSGPTESDYKAKLFRRENGTFKEWTPSALFVPFDGAMPSMAEIRVGQAVSNGPFRILKTGKYTGTITYSFGMWLPLTVDEQSVQPGDTLRFDIQIKDQSNLWSNTVATSEFVFFKR